MSKVTIISRVNPITKKQIQRLAKNNHLTQSNIIRFILQKSLSDNPNFINPEKSIKRFRKLRVQLAKIEENISQLNNYFTHGFSNLNQIARTLNIIIKGHQFMMNDLYNYFVYSLNGINLKKSLKLIKQMNNKINQVWNFVNKEIE